MYNIYAYIFKYVYVCNAQNNFLIHPSIDGYVVWLNFSDIVNRTARNLHAEVPSLYAQIFFLFLETCILIILYNGRTYLHSFQLLVSILLFPHLCLDGCSRNFLWAASSQTMTQVLSINYESSSLAQIYPNSSYNLNKPIYSNLYSVTWLVISSLHTAHDVSSTSGWQLFSLPPF